MRTVRSLTDVLLLLFCVSVHGATFPQWFTTNTVTQIAAPADGWFLGWSNGVPVWTLNGITLTNVSGGGGSVAVISPIQATTNAGLITIFSDNWTNNDMAVSNNLYADIVAATNGFSLVDATNNDMAVSNNLYLDIVSATNNALTLATNNDNLIGLNATNNDTLVSNGLYSIIQGLDNPTNNDMAVSNNLYLDIVSATNNALALATNNDLVVSNNLYLEIVSATNNALTLSSNFSLQIGLGGSNNVMVASNTLWLSSSNLVYQGTNGLTVPISQRVLTNESRNLVFTSATNRLGTNVNADFFWGDGSNLTGLTNGLETIVDVTAKLVSATNNALTLSSNFSLQIGLSGSNNVMVASNNLFLDIVSATNNALTLSSNFSLQIGLGATNQSAVVSNALYPQIVAATNNALALATNNDTATSNNLYLEIVSATNNALTLSSNFSLQIGLNGSNNVSVASNSLWAASSNLTMSGISDFRLNNVMSANAYSLPYNSENKQSVTLATGENLVHGFIFALNKFWGTTLTSPAKLLRFNNPNDLTDYTVLTFANDGNHNNGYDIVYIPAKGKLYVVIRVASSGSAINVSEVDPVTLTVTDRIHDTTFDGASDSLTFDNTSLYVAANAASTIAGVAKFDLSTWALTASVSMSTGLLANAHAIRYDGTNLFVTGQPPPGNPGWIARVKPSDLTYFSVIFQAGDEQATDDMALVGENVWVGLEATIGTVLKISKSDLSITRISTGVANSASYGLFFDGRYVWNCIPNSPGVLQRIDPATLEMWNYTLASGENTLNEVFSDGQRLFATCYLSPAKIIRLTDPVLSYSGGGSGSAATNGITSGLIQGKFPSAILTNGGTVVVTYSNTFQLDAAHSLVLSNVTGSRLLFENANHTVTSAAASGAVPVDADGSATTFAQVAALGSFLTNNESLATVFSNTVAVDIAHTLSLSNLTASRIVLSSASDTLVSAAASGAVPVDADGSATTSAQLVTALGVFTTVGETNPIIAKSANYTLVSTTDQLVLMNGNLSATLPTAVGIGGKNFIIKCVTSGTNAILTTSSQTIDGSTKWTNTAIKKFTWVISDNANWQVIGQN